MDMIYKLKVGDKVEIAEDLDSGWYFDINEDMYKYKGSVGVIQSVNNDNYMFSYTLDVDENDECRRWSWYADALTLIRD